MIYIRIILFLLVIGSLGGYECGNATFLQAVFNALLFLGAFIISLHIDVRKKSTVRKKLTDGKKAFKNHYTIIITENK